jgi:hypothetical protein
VAWNTGSVEAWDIARGNFGDRLAEKISSFGPATAESKGDIVALDAREFLDNGRGIRCQ